MKLIIGLGNPGQKYNNTRHNVGFEILDLLSKDFKFEKKFHAEIAKNGELLLAKPQTFMNLSGSAVQAIMTFYKITPDNLTVIHDDLDINIGEYKIQTNRSSAGHNGVQSIIDTLGTKDFHRIRVGIKSEKANPNIPVENFVLNKFSKEEEKIIEGVKKEVVTQINQMSF
jgi:PTH1 family peptidyl-tRNA hydrolase